MNVSEIITAFGAYYLNSGQNMNNILRMLTQGAVTPSFMTPIKTEETIYRMSSVTVGSLVQSFQKDWTPSDPGIFVPNEIRKRHMKGLIRTASIFFRTISKTPGWVFWLQTICPKRTGRLSVT